MTRGAWVAPALVALWAAWSFVPLLGGYFLSDDFVPLALFDLWREQGRLGAALLEKFWTGLDAGANNFYRPLSYLTFALSYLTSGVNPLPWMALDVAVHLASGALVALVAWRLSGRAMDTRTVAAAAAGAALFLFMPPTVEVVAWVSGRFDGFATLFTLLCCERFLASRRAGDGAWIASLAAAAAAMLSKESAAIVPFAVLLFAWARVEGGPRSVDRVRAALKAAWPWLALAAAYLAWRKWMFGSATVVYGGSSPASAALSAGFWVHVSDAVPAWLASVFDNPPGFAAACALVLAHLIVVAMAWPAQAPARAVLAASAIAVVSTVLLFLPAVVWLPANGIGGRLLHQTAAFYGIFAAVALCAGRRQNALWMLTVALIVVLAGVQQGTLARWQEAHRQSQRLVAEIARVAAELKADDYALVLVPGPLDQVPFARNAQAGLMLPPVQREVLSRRLLVQLDEEIPELPAKLVEGLVPTLRKGTVYDFVEGRRIRPAVVEYPSAVFCWDARRAALAPLAIDPGPSPAQWAARLKAALDASACSVSPTTHNTRLAAIAR